MYGRVIISLPRPLTPSMIPSKQKKIHTFSLLLFAATPPSPSRFPSLTLPPLEVEDDDEDDEPTVLTWKKFTLPPPPTPPFPFVEEVGLVEEGGGWSNPNEEVVPPPEEEEEGICLI